MNQPIVVLDRVTKRFVRGAETITAVAGASLELHPGTFTVIRGPSGSGKTTLLNLVVGWDDPDEGTVRGLGGPP
ncbi:MAG TPA: ATP-binding cassette domain-containing protein, partial [Ilumatobacteraceae bacterium]